MLKRLAEIGLNKEDSSETRRNVALMNKINLVLLLIDIIYILKSFFQGYPSEIIFLFVGFSSFCGVIFLLNFFRIFALSRFLISVGPIILSSVLYSAVSQGENDYLLGSLYTVYTACSIPFIIFSIKEKGMLISSFLFCALVTLFIKDLNIWIDIPFDNSGAKSVFNYYLTIILSLAALFAAMYMLLTHTEGEEKKSIETIKALENRNSEFEISRKQLEESLAEIEKAREEEIKRKWASDGMAKFATIMRSRANIENLSYDIISNLVRYIGANQAGIFITDEVSDKTIVLEMKACYAYERKKYLTKRIAPGEGLIGQCFIEKETIYMTRVPQNYVSITSGLGQATPGCLILVPLKINDTIEGVLEIASFKQFESHVIDFIEKIAESIASSVAMVKINERTHLLLSQSQQQAEEMRAQEEEMRQNLEELQATQEEMQRKEIELQMQSETMALIIDNIPFPVFIKDHKGRYVMVNKAEAEIFNVSKEEIIGFDDGKFVSDSVEMQRIRDSDRKIVEENLPVHFPDQVLTLDNGDIKVFKTSKIPFFNKQTNQINILGVSVDLSDTKNVERELMKEISKLQDQLKQAIEQ